MFNSWIIVSDPIVSLDLVEILKQHFNDVTPKVFKASQDALELHDALPDLAILRATRHDETFKRLHDLLCSAKIPLILLEPQPSNVAAENIQSVPLPFSSEHIDAALTALFGASQKPTLRPAPR